VGESIARRSKEMSRHSGLGPESSLSIKFSGALRRRKRFWIPDQVRNDGVLGFSPGVGFGIARRNPRKIRMRRVAPERRTGGLSSALRKPPDETHARDGL
jgi:hypothetical protein